MDTLKIERELQQELDAEKDPEKRAKIKERLNTLLMIDIERWRESEEREQLNTRLAIAENK